MQHGPGKVEQRQRLVFFLSSSGTGSTSLGPIQLLISLKIQRLRPVDFMTTKYGMHD